jgi:RimJ/RimL family protein N-acetyltransferase
MTVRHLDDAEAVAEALRDVPLDPVVDTVLLSVLDRCLTDPSAYPDRHWWIVEDATGVVGVAFQTPPWSLGLGLEPGPWLGELVMALIDSGWAGTDVQAEGSRVKAFAAEWTARTGEEWSTVETMRLLRCVDLRPPTGVDGHARLVRIEECDLLARWLEEFNSELRLLAEGFAAGARRLIGRAQFWVDPEPVSLACFTPAQRGVSRVGPVYTPPEHRRHGYAGGVTAAVTQAAYDGGADQVVLYTEAANPTSNAVYERLGYVHELDAVHLRRAVPAT